MYYSREERNKTFLKHLKDYAHSVIGETLGNNREEDEINIWLCEVLAHYKRDRVQPKDNLIELKRILKAKNEK